MATWADTELRFDMSFSEMSLLNGEKILDSLENIEDFKGNKGHSGVIFVTNLRIVWYSVRNVYTNIGIGFKCIINVGSKLVNNQNKVVSKALNIFAQYNSTRYEFIFTSLLFNNSRLFLTFFDVYRSYLSTKLYREIKFRGSFIHNRQLKTLPSESISNVVNGVWNLSSDQGCLGTFIVTNIRLIWFSNLNEDFNISLPYIQVEEIKTQDSKFGNVLVLKIKENGGNFILGFKTDIEEKLTLVYKELSSRFSVFLKGPIFGTECRSNSENHSVFQTAFPSLEDFQTNDSKEESSDVLSSYVTVKGNLEKSYTYSSELGLAIQTLKGGYTLKKLWSIV